jgi:hypothetical protein
MPGSSARSPSPGITGVRETRERQSSLLDEDHDREIEMKSAPVLDHHEPMKVDVAAGLARTSGGFWRGGVEPSIAKLALLPNLHSGGRVP